MNCTLCPRNCNVNRSTQNGVCKTNNVVLSRVAPHMWEEPCVSGTKGSGTVFFAGCNLQCRFCQNHEISVVPKGVEVTTRQLADVFLRLQDMGVANVNLVTPTHFSNKIASALQLVKHQLSIPVVYNTGSYEKVEALKQLHGLVDVYLPDLKFASPTVSKQLANCPNYFQVATKAIEEMRRQQPNDIFNAEGYITNGLIIRHLVLPGFVEDSKLVLDWIAQFGKQTIVSLMSQYFPARTDELLPQLNRKLFRHEYNSIVDYFSNVGLQNGFLQDLQSATQDYLPNFDKDLVLQLLSTLPNN